MLFQSIRHYQYAIAITRRNRACWRTMKR